MRLAKSATPWAIAGLTTGTYTWVVTATDLAGNFTNSDPFTMDLTVYDPAQITAIVYPDCL